MNYGESLRFIEETKKYGIVPGLGNIRNLMEELGNVQDTLAVVHIAGTNGKGSVGAFLLSVFRQAGYHVGRFSSPEVFCYEEIFWYDDAPADRAELAEAFTQVKAACVRLVKAGKPHPTRFEVETAAAFVLYAKKNCDVVLLEVGMGGAEDATNVIESPILSVLTSISMDHMQYLGDTLEAIADVKAGIIKPDCPVVAVRRSDEVCQVIRKKCLETKSTLIWADAEHAEQISMRGEYLQFSYHSAPSLCESYRLRMGGRYQIENAICAIEAAHMLRKSFPAIMQETICAGLESAVWKGRFSKLGSKPDFYIDGAHNPDAAKKLRETLEFCFPGEKLICIMGVLADKAVGQILDEMLPKAERIITVTPDNPRAMDGESLAELIRGKGGCSEHAPKIKDAVWRAIEEAERTGRRILAFGSLSYLKEVDLEYEKRKTDYINLVLHHSLFADTLKRIGELEADRIYCCHQLEHLLDVARIAWIKYLEDEGKLCRMQKTDMYVCALLHDIGRAQQYEHGVSHVEAGVKLAKQILEDIAYPEKRREEILQAIGMHRKKDEILKSGVRNLSYYIVQADHLSRSCFSCKAIDTCKWSKENRNQYIEI